MRLASGFQGGSRKWRFSHPWGRFSHFLAAFSHKNASLEPPCAHRLISCLISSGTAVESGLEQAVEGRSEYRMPSLGASHMYLTAPSCKCVAFVLQFPFQSIIKEQSTFNMQRRNWKELTKDGVLPQHAAPYAASINPKGTIYISYRTWQNMGEPQAFKILFDDRNSCLGLQPTSPSAKNAYKLGKGSRPRGYRPIYANRLIIEWGIEVPDVLNFVNPEPDHDGILILNLRTAKISNQAVKHWTRKIKRGEGEIVGSE